MKSRWWWVLALGVANFAVAWLLTAPFSAALAPLLDGRGRVDDAVLFEVFSDHRELLGVAAAGAIAAIVIWGLFSQVVAAWLVGVRDAAQLGRVLAVGAFGVGLRAVPLLAGAVVWLGLWPLSHDRGFTQLAARVLVTAVAFAFVWSLVTVAIDYARAGAVAGPVREALRAALRRPLPSLAAWSLGAHVAVTLAYHALAYVIPWFLVVTLLRIALAVARAAITVGVLLRARDLRSASDRGTPDSALRYPSA